MESVFPCRHYSHEGIRISFRRPTVAPAPCQPMVQEQELGCAPPSATTIIDGVTLVRLPAHPTCEPPDEDVAASTNSGEYTSEDTVTGSPESSPFHTGNPFSVLMRRKPPPQLLNPALSIHRTPAAARDLDTASGFVTVRRHRRRGLRRLQPTPSAFHAHRLLPYRVGIFKARQSPAKPAAPTAMLGPQIRQLRLAPPPGEVWLHHQPSSPTSKDDEHLRPRGRFWGNSDSDSEVRQSAANEEPSPYWPTAATPTSVSEDLDWLNTPPKDEAIYSVSCTIYNSAEVNLSQRHFPCFGRAMRRLF